MQARILKRFVIALAIVGAATAAVYARYDSSGPLLHAADASPPVTSLPPQSTGPVIARGGADFSAIVAQYGPAVVNISVSGTMKTADNSPFRGLDPNDPFYDFFRHFRVPQPQGEVPTHGMGSGFIVSPKGIILTNAHVVAGADEVTVKLTDKREFKAKVLGLDKATDVAVLRIDASDLPTVRLGNPTQARVGEWVLAIGAPFGFENTATAGIISAKSRSLPDEGYVPFIQTDVAVNPGNSGGPLFNANGEVIGINSQIYSRTGGYQGLSFAIPIDVALKVQDQIVAHGKVAHGLLGVTVQDVNQALADAFGLKKPIGALVSAVKPGGPGARAGVQVGDVILSFNGTEIGRSSELPPLVGGIAPGTGVKLQVWRKGETRELQAKLGDFDDGTPIAANDAGTAEPGRLGVAVRPLTADEKRDAELAGGVLVEDAKGAAARAGIRPGDVILAVNGESVGNVAQLRALVAKAGKRAAILVQRDESKIFVPVELG